LPNPFCEFFEDILFFPKKSRAKFDDLLFLRKSENLEYLNWLNSGCVGSNQSFKHGSPYSFGLDHKEFLQKIEENYIGHHLFEWKKPRTVWFSTTKPVYIDFGGNLVWLMQKYYKDRGLWCVQKFKKETLISKLGGCFPFYPPF
jgi:hypothetical protein